MDSDVNTETGLTTSHGSDISKINNYNSSKDPLPIPDVDGLTVLLCFLLQ